MADGSTRPISEITIGDEVAAKDPTTGEEGARQVTLLHSNRDFELTDVIVSAQPADEAEKKSVNEGKGDRSTRGPTESSVLETTAHHPFWDATTGTWTDAANLTAGESTLVGPDGQIQYVTKVRNHTGPQVMRDLTVNDIHTYYVIAGNEPVLVHNNNSACPVVDPGTQVESGSTDLSQATRSQRVIDQNKGNLYAAAKVKGRIFVAHSNEDAHAEQWLVADIRDAGFDISDIDEIYTEYGMCPGCQGRGRGKGSIEAILPQLRPDTRITYSIPFANPASRPAARVALKAITDDIFSRK